MSGRQAIMVLLAVALVALLCLTVLFPLIHRNIADVDDSTTAGVDSGKNSRAVLPKLKGVTWETEARTEGEGTSPEAALKKQPPKKKPPAKPKEPKTIKDEDVLKKPEQAESEVVPLLEVHGWEWAEADGFVTVQGRVKNITDESMVGIRVHVTFHDEMKNTVVSEHAMIKLNPLFPNQISTFELSLRYQPEMNEAVIDFRTFAGDKVPFREAVAE